MFKQKIVFVVGAGASTEVGLLCGTKFKDALSQKLRRPRVDPNIGSALDLYLRSPEGIRGNISSYLDAAHLLSQLLLSELSIDEIFFHHSGKKEIELCGKLAIARYILEGENKSDLQMAPRRRWDFGKLSTTWYMSLWSLMKQETRSNDPGAIFENVSFVVFNYDRCVEQFLYHVLRHSSQISSDDAATILRPLKIFHPYGSLGKLPWQTDFDSVAFGDVDISDSLLLALTKNIRTISDDMDDPTFLREIQSVINEAATVVFLGFAYHEPNMQLLTPKTSKQNVANVFATAYEIDQRESSAIRSRIRSVLGESAHIEQIDFDMCSHLFKICWLRLGQR